MSILDNLNDMQKKAAEILEGQTLILAGAGSGKTRTITFKIAHMIKERNINPKNILALTFTNKAAREMKERAESLIGSNTDILITTFHSFALRLLRIYSERIGYGTNFNVYDTNDQRSIIKKIIKKYDWEKLYKPAQILNKISRIKELGIKYTELWKIMDLKIQENSHLKTIYMEYQEKLEKYNAMDFSDILTNAYELLNDSYILDKVQSKYIYVLVDEYQDTNEIQYKIIKKIVSKNKNICVVGDEDQSIYAFRGANIQNILNFEKDYPEANVIKLEQNYRSTQNILDGANSVIKNNTSSKGKKLWSGREIGEKIKIYNANDVNDEANFVANKIRELHRNGKNYKNFAILYRTNAQSRALEEALHRNSIPYKIFGGLGFFERKEIKDLIAYLQLINNSSDDISFERIINTPKRAIGPKSIESISKIAAKNNLSLLEASKLVTNDISNAALKKLENFNILISKSKEMIENTTTSVILENLIKQIKYYDYLKLEENYEERLENVYELISSIQSIEVEEGILLLPNFLENIMINSASDDIKNDEEYVKLMTVHSSKGLEFNTVFLTGLEENLFPRLSLLENLEEEEEERRIFYVAVTRAEELLFITHSLERATFGFTSHNPRSRFLDELNENNIENLNNPNLIIQSPRVENSFSVREYLKNNSIQNSKENLVTIDCDFELKEIVSHKEFGIGIITEITPKSITVKFSEGAKKFPSKIANKFLKKELKL